MHLTPSSSFSLQINIQYSLFCHLSFPPPSAEIGDFDETQSWQHLLHNKYLPDQDAIRDKITDCHRKHVWVIGSMHTQPQV